MFIEICHYYWFMNKWQASLLFQPLTTVHSDPSRHFGVADVWVARCPHCRPFGGLMLAPRWRRPDVLLMKSCRMPHRNQCWKACFYSCLDYVCIFRLSGFLLHLFRCVSYTHEYLLALEFSPACTYIICLCVCRLGICVL